MKRRTTFEDRVLNTVLYLFFILFSFSVIFPFWTVIVASISVDERLGFAVVPVGFSLEAYKEVLTQKTLLYAYMNSFLRTSVGTVSTVTVTLCAAYALSKRKIPLIKTMTAVIVIPMFFGGGLIPTYLLIRSLGLIDNRWVLILPFVYNGFYIMVTRNFLYSIPPDLEESAYIDGANELTIAFKIIFPLSIPIVATCALWSAVAHWNEWFAAMIYLYDPQKQVMQVLLRRILLEAQPSALFDDPSYTPKLTETSVRSATLIVTIAPILAIYPFVQKYFVSGLTSGAVKG